MLLDEFLDESCVIRFQGLAQGGRKFSLERGPIEFECFVGEAHKLLRAV